MKCSNCGKEIPNDAVFCLYCGEKVIPIVNVQDIFGNTKGIARDEKEPDKTETEETVKSTPVDTHENFTSNESPAGEPKSEKKIGLKWYYFVIYCAIWLAMLSTLSAGLSYILGFNYGNGLKGSEAVYIYRFLQ